MLVCNIDNIKMRSICRPLRVKSREALTLYSVVKLAEHPLNPMFGNMMNTLRRSFSTRSTPLISQHAAASAKTHWRRNRSAEQTNWAACPIWPSVVFLSVRTKKCMFGIISYNLPATPPTHIVNAGLKQCAMQTLREQWILYQQVHCVSSDRPWERLRLITMATSVLSCGPV